MQSVIGLVAFLATFAAGYHVGAWVNVHERLAIEADLAAALARHTATKKRLRATQQRLRATQQALRATRREGNKA